MYNSPTSVDIVYVTELHHIGPEALTSKPADAPSVVLFGTAPKGPFKSVKGTSTMYTQQYNFRPDVDLPYRSPRIHRIRLSGELWTMNCLSFASVRTK